MHAFQLIDGGSLGPMQLFGETYYASAIPSSRLTGSVAAGCSSCS